MITHSRHFALFIALFITATVFAQLGVGNKKNIIQLAAGSSHNLALQNNGSLWAWGNNASGQLGDSSTTDRENPVQVGTENNWATVTAGGSFTHAIKKDGTLWGWGINKVGQLGISTKNLKYMYTTPVQVGKDNDWQAVSSGQYFTVGLKTDGTIWIWGANIYYLLPKKTNQYEPLKIADKNNKDWKQIAAGDEFFMAIKKDGTIWTMGAINKDNDKVLVKINEDTDWESIDAGRQHAMAIKKDGSLWGWGANETGQLGNGTTVNSKDPVKVGENFAAVSATANYTIAIKKFEGYILWWGKSWMNNTDQLKPAYAKGMSTYPLIAAGYNSLLMLIDNVSIMEFSKQHESGSVKMVK